VSPQAIATAVALLAAAVGAGCGGADRADDATRAAGGFQRALSDRDGRAACAQLSDETAAELERDEQKACADAILDLDLPTGGSVAPARVSVRSASVEEASGRWIFLDEAPDGWAVSAAGCKPTEPEQPLDCELED
jgi:hypothetical protein